ncbi:MAG: hypothetical protein JWN96_198, partial [Mycobacterium sp.]|nr:hypothetical protein [Mycobacterium sp.]
MRVLVTGARGKVGGAAAAELERRGHRVVGTDIGTPVYESHGAIGRLASRARVPIAYGEHLYSLEDA